MSEAKVKMNKTQKLCFFFTSFCYVGKIPKAPGTAGSFVALPLAWYLWQLPLLAAWGLIAFTFAIGVIASNQVVKATKRQDDQTIVIDEVVGIFVTTAAATQDLFHYCLAFFLFRALDIWKPGPIGWADRKYKGGMGVMLDDALAGLCAAIILFAILFFEFSMFKGPI